MDDDEYNAGYDDLLKDREAYLQNMRDVVGPLPAQRYPMKPSGTFSRPSVQQTAVFCHGTAGRH